jgi:hypothetical protein
MEQRAALVTIGDSSQGQVVAKYLPSNYKVVEVHDTYVLVVGVDNAGWTLDDYVIPRLASGLFRAEETEVPEEYTPAGMRQRAAEELAAEFGNDPEEWLV